MNVLTNEKRAAASALQRALRAATRIEQMTFDRILLRFDFARREDYGLYLNVHRAALESLRSDWRLQDLNDFSAMVQCIESDLQTLDLTTSSLKPRFRPSFTIPGQLGLAYVVRGSRLNVSLLRQRVLSQFATSYLDFVPATSWVLFLTQLDTFSGEPGSDIHIIQGAKATARTFLDVLSQAIA
jgi:heme oxygenase